MKKIFLFLVLGLVSCANKPQIAPSTDWEQKGISDSKASEPVQTAPPEKSQTEFCTYQGGLQFGQQGGIYTGNCPKTLERAFKKGYLKGRAEYDKQHPQEGNN